MSSNPRLALLRERLHQPPSSDAFEAVCAVFDGWTSHDLDVGLSYAQEHLAAWPDRHRQAPGAGCVAAMEGDAPPWWPLARRAVFAGLTLHGVRRLISNRAFAALDRIDIRSTKLGPKGIERLSKGRHLSKLRVWVLAYCDLEPEAMEPLATSKALKRLEVLDLYHNRLMSRGVQSLARCPSLTRLRRLRLSSNNVGIQGTRALAKAPALGRLEALALAACNRGDHDVYRAMLAELCANTALGALRELDFSNNWVGGAAIEAMAASPLLAGLTHLNLHGCKHGDRGTAAIAASPNATSLRWLNLSDSYTNRGQDMLTDAGLTALATSERLHALRALDLSGNRLGLDGIKALGQARMPNLHTLDLANTPLTDEAIDHLAQSPLADNLKVLGLSGWALTSDAARALARSTRLIGLERLNLGGNRAITLDALTDLIESPVGRALTHIVYPRRTDHDALPPRAIAPQWERPTAALRWTRSPLPEEADPLAEDRTVSGW